jgi:hypothetical protein
LDAQPVVASEGEQDEEVYQPESPGDWRDIHVGYDWPQVLVVKATVLAGRAYWPCVHGNSRSSGGVFENGGEKRSEK